ncbi:MAG: hypothetical protein AAFQ82_21510, partial [Myxococcota bacterium]
RDAVAGGAQSDHEPFAKIVERLERLSLKHRHSMADAMKSLRGSTTSDHTCGVLEAYYVRRLMLEGLDSVNLRRDFDLVAYEGVTTLRASGDWTRMQSSDAPSVARSDIARALRDGPRKRDYPASASLVDESPSRNRLCQMFHTDQVIQIKDELARRGLPDTIDGGVEAFLRGDDLKTLTAEERGEAPFVPGIGLREDRMREDIAVGPAKMPATMPSHHAPGELVPLLKLFIAD